MREIKKPPTSRTATNNCSLQKTVTNLLHKSVLQLCKDSVQFGSQLQIMGVLCMTIDDECSDIVVKVNETFRKDDGEVEQPAASRSSPQREHGPATGAGKYGYACENGFEQAAEKPSVSLPDPSCSKRHETTINAGLGVGNAASASRSDTVSDCGISTCSSSADCGVIGTPFSAAQKHSHKRKRSPKKFLLQNWVEKQQRQAAALGSSPAQKVGSAAGTSSQSKVDYDALANAIQRRAQPLESTASTIPESTVSSASSTSTGNAAVLQCTPKRAAESGVTPKNTPKKNEQDAARVTHDASANAEINAAMNGFVGPSAIIVPIRTASQFVPGSLQHHVSPLVPTLNGYAHAHAQAALQNAHLAALQNAQINAIHNAQISALQNSGSQQAHAVRGAYLDVPYFVPVRNAPPAHTHPNVPSAPHGEPYANGSQPMPSDLRLATMNDHSMEHSSLGRPALLVRHVGDSPAKHGLLKQFDVAAHRGGAASLPNSPMKRRDRDGQPSILALAEAAEFVQRQAADSEPHDATPTYITNPMTVALSPAATTPKWASPSRSAQAESFAAGGRFGDQPATELVSHFDTLVGACLSQQLETASATNELTTADFEQSDDAESQRNAIRPKSASRKRIGVPRNRPASGSGTDSIGGSASATRRKRVSSAFKCNQCESSFATLGELTHHTVSQHGAYKCTVCSLHFTQRSNLQRHSLRHVGFKPYKCALCAVEYYRKDHLIRHVSTVHSGTDVRTAVIERLSSSECLSYLERMRSDSRSDSANRSADIGAEDDLKAEDDVKLDAVANEEEVVFADADGDSESVAPGYVAPGTEEKPDAYSDTLLRVVSPNVAQFEDVSDEEHDDTLKELSERVKCDSDTQCESGSAPKKVRSESALSVEECTMNVRECLANGGQAEGTK